MTDNTPAMSAEEAAGRALVARTHFEKEAVWLPSLAVQHWNAGQMAIDGKTFTDCVIEGPAVMLVLEGTHFDGVDFGPSGGDLRNILFRPMSGQRAIGAVPVRNCTFRNCQFHTLGITGSDDLLQMLVDQVGAAG